MIIYFETHFPVQMSFVYLGAFVFAYALESFNNIISFDIYKDKLNLEFHDILKLSLVGSISTAILANYIPLINKHLSYKMLCILDVLLYSIGLYIMQHSTVLYLQIIAKICCGFGASLLFSCFDLWFCIHVEKQGINYKNVVGNAVLLNNLMSVFLGLTTDYIGSYFWVFSLISFQFLYYFENYKNTSSFNSKEKVIETNGNEFTTVLLCHVAFESAVILFIFSWQSLKLFVDFPVSVNTTYSLLTLVSGLGGYLSKYVSLSYLRVAMLSSLVFFVLFYYFTNQLNLVFMFMTFELAIGLFYPLLSTIREQWTDHERNRYQSLSQVLISLMVAILVISTSMLKVTEKQYTLLIALMLLPAFTYSLRLHNPQVKTL